MGEGPYRNQPEGDKEFNPAKHVMIDKKSWVRKTALESDDAAKVEAERRSQLIEEPNWFLILFGKTNKETYLDILQEEALEHDLGELCYRDKYVNGNYNNHHISLSTEKKGVEGSIDYVKIKNSDAKKIWKKLWVLKKQTIKNKKNIKRAEQKEFEKREQEEKKLRQEKERLKMLETKRPVAEVLGLLPQRPKKELLETTEPKQIPEKTEE